MTTTQPLVQTVKMEQSHAVTVAEKEKRQSEIPAFYVIRQGKCPARLVMEQERFLLKMKHLLPNRSRKAGLSVPIARKEKLNVVTAAERDRLMRVIPAICAISQDM